MTAKRQKHRGRVWACAGAGNAAAVFWLATVLIHRGVLVESGGRRADGSAAMDPARSFGPSPTCMVFVVLDALGAEAADNPRRMPRLAALKREGVAGWSRVESLVPSTVAGIETLVGGVPPPPASFLRDFGSGPTRRGGVFAAVRAGRRDSFVAGPRLWRDLYGAWIDDGLFLSTLGHADGRLVSATLEAIRSGQYGFVVLHLSECDDLAHLHGRRSHAYAEGTRHYDEALGRLRAALDPGTTALVVTSDHGVSATGGHAGPEPAVLQTPLLLWGDVFRGFTSATWRQSQLPKLLSGAMGLSWESGEASGDRSLRTWPGAAVPLLAGFVAVLFFFLARLREASHLPLAAWTLHGSLWAAVALWYFAFPRFSLLLLLAAGVSAGMRVGRGTAASTARTLLFALASGLLLGAVRVGLAWWTLDRSSPLVAGGACACVLLSGAVASVGAVPRARLGLWLVHLPVALALLLGEGVSLSTIDVAFAFEAVDGALGLGGAAALVVARQMLPTVVVVAVAWGRLVRTPLADLREGLAVAAAVLIAQTLVAGLFFATGVGTPPWGSLAVGLLVRLFGELQFLFLSAACLLMVAARFSRETE